MLDSLVESLPKRARPARRQLPAGVPARLGQQDLLSAAPHRPAAAGERGRAARGPARRRPVDRAAAAATHRADGGQPALPRGERADPRGDAAPSPASPARTGSSAPRTMQMPATVQAILAARIDRLPAELKRLLQAAAVMGKDVPVASSPASRRSRTTTCTRRWASCRPRSSCTKRGCSPTSSTRSSTPSPTRWLTAACSRSAGARSTPRSSRRSSACTPTASASTPRCSRTMPCGRPSPTRPSAICAQAGSKALRPLREPGGHRFLRAARWRSSPSCPRRARRSRRPRRAHRARPSPHRGARPAGAGRGGVVSAALELVERLDDAARRFLVLWGLWYIRFTRGDYPAAVKAGERLLETPRRGDDIGQLLEAHHALWPTLVSMGEVRRPLPHLERGIALYERERHGSRRPVRRPRSRHVLPLLPGAEPWGLGYPERALAAAYEAARLAETLGHAMTSAMTLSFVASILSPPRRSAGRHRRRGAVHGHRRCARLRGRDIDSAPRPSSPRPPTWHRPDVAALRRTSGSGPRKLHVALRGERLHLAWLYGEAGCPSKGCSCWTAWATSEDTRGVLRLRDLPGGRRAAPRARRPGLSTKPRGASSGPSIRAPSRAQVVRAPRRDKPRPAEARPGPAQGRARALADSTAGSPRASRPRTCGPRKPCSTSSADIVILPS